MHRAIRPGIALVACVVAVLLALPLAVGTQRLREAVVSQIADRAGLVTEHMGRITIAFLPIPHVKIRHLKLRNSSSSWSADARAVDGELRLSALLTGRLELKSLTMVQPHLAVDLDAQPAGDASLVARALRLPAGSPDALAADATSLGTLRIVSGTMRLESRARHSDAIVSDIDATLDWPALGRPAVLGGSAVWTGHRAFFDVTSASPMALLRGLPTQTTLRLRSDLADVDAAGSFAEAPRKQFTGTLRAKTPSLHEIARLLGIEVPLPGPLEAAGINGEVTLAGGKLWVTGAQAMLDGNAFEGTLAVSAARGHVAITGTLATDLLQLDAIAGALPALRDPEGGWSREPLNVAALPRHDLDLRISAARVRLGDARVEDAALGLLMKDGRLEVVLADAKAYGGSLRIRGIGRSAFPSVDFKLDGSFANVDLASLFASAPRGGWITGTASGKFVVENAGESPAAILAGLKGQARVDVDAGELIGIDVEKALRRVGKRPLLAALELLSGRTPFDHLAFGATLSSGVARIREGVATGPAARIDLSGSVSVPERSVNLRALATQTGAAQGNLLAEAPKFAFDVGGTWDAPFVEPDAATLIRQSGAAAPLFLTGQASIGWGAATGPQRVAQ